MACSIIVRIMPYYSTPYRSARRNTKPEESVQKRVCAYLKKNYPDLDYHSDYAAGLHLTMAQAVTRKALNSGRGWADLLVMKPSRGYGALFLELKKPGTSIYVTKGPRKGELVKDEQIEIEAAFLKRMNDLGYLARFCVGYEASIKLINWYMEKPEDTEVF